MREGSAKKSKLSWSKSLVRKWFNIRNKGQDFHADFDAGQVNTSFWLFQHRFAHFLLGLIYFCAFTFWEYKSTIPAHKMAGILQTFTFAAAMWFGKITCLIQESSLLEVGVIHLS